MPIPAVLFHWSAMFQLLAISHGNDAHGKYAHGNYANWSYDVFVSGRGADMFYALSRLSRRFQWGL